jgi:hypothetical protein
MAEWFKAHPKQAPVPFSLEKVGQPSKMISLKAMMVLKRLGEARSQSLRFENIKRQRCLMHR